MNDRLIIEYSAIPESITLAGELCPSCRGGRTRERSFSVTKSDGKLFYKCHRDSCQYAGVVNVGGSTRGGHYAAIPDTRGVVGREILRQSKALEGDTKHYLRERYGITEHHIQKWELGWDEDTNRLSVPVTDFLGNRLGVVLRALDNSKPKTKTHAEQGAMSWFVNHATPGLIIVEDQFSAIRASDFLTSVALLGTHLNEERVEEIRTSSLSPVYLALDADAWATAIKHVVKHRSRLKMVPVQLDKDLKDKTDEELKEFFHILIAEKE